MITFALPVEAHVTLRVYDVYGREAAVLVDGRRVAGTHMIAFDAASLPSGMYVFRLESGTVSVMRSMILAR